MNTNDTMIVLAAVCVILLCILRPFIRRRRFEKDYPYEKKMLLTAAEYRFYRILKERCDKNDLLICPKVRMEDFLQVTDRQNINKYRGYIKSRHIDFIICDKDLYMLAGLELDDSSHDTDAAAVTDAFKNNVFKKIKIPLYRIPVEPKMYKSRIDEMIRDLVRKS
ncbi:MAG: DUF2726 domain-containing protein [Lachnospiraceae bacterium]|nr:DUF2726 domain-containing protein [Lachnospiraceae bacterium]